MGGAIFVGILCGLCAVAIFAAGFAAGWKLRGASGALPKAAPPLTDEQKQRVEAARREEEAFRALQNYDMGAAYGMGADEP